MKGTLLFFSAILLAVSVGLAIVGIQSGYIYEHIAVYFGITTAIVGCTLGILEIEVARTAFVQKTEDIKELLQRRKKIKRRFHTKPVITKSEMTSKVMFLTGIFLLVVGVALSIIQLSWKVEQKLDMPSGLKQESRFKLSVQTSKVGTGEYYNRLDEGYLHLGIGLAIVGALMAVGSFVAKSHLPIGTPITKQPVPQTPVVETPKAPESTEKPEGTDVPEQIEKLSKLKEQGILSDEEFEEKKKELLARM